MSEYQYYEFQSIDRLLTDSELESIKKLSSRGNVSRNQAIFVYNYGDFRYEPVEILADYFDIMLYMANWGTRRLCFRLPKTLVNFEEIALYNAPDVITTSIINDYVIIDIYFTDENSGWIDGDDILQELLPLRNDLLQGNYQALYIAWLGSLTQENLEEIDDHQLEPPIPTGLKKPSASLNQLIEFLGIDINLIEIAATESAEESKFELDAKQWLSKLPNAERDNFLLQLLKGECNVDKKLHKRLREIANSHTNLKNGLRTVSQLLAAAEQLAIEKKEKKRLEKAEAKTAKLNLLAPQESQIWVEVHNQINTKTSKGYEKAVKLLIDLKDLANHLSTTDQFISKVKKIRQDYSRYSSLKAKMIAKGII